MGRSGGKKKGKNNKKNAASTANTEQEGMIWVDPARVRFQHSKIRPLFSGCGHSIYDTLESIRKQEISSSDLPPIQVIVGPETEEGRWYFSLNNRRLWVLKRCREEGLLENNQIQVRVRSPKSNAEALRYSLENCALEAKVMREPEKRANAKVQEEEEKEGGPTVEETKKMRAEAQHDNKQLVSTYSTVSDDESEYDSDDDKGFVSKNPFSALL